MKVEELLLEKAIDYKVSGRDFLTKCLNPDHEDTNPSMRIDNTTGIFHCFSCGFKGSVFKHFGALPNFLEIKRQSLREKIQEKRAGSSGYKMPKGYSNYIGNWRGINPETYKNFEAFTHPHPQFNGRVVFPVTNIMGKIVAFIGRHMTYTATPRYMIAPSKATLPLYPPVVEPIKGRIILVEGIFDMINLFDKGLSNAICCFGTNNVDVDKLSILKLQNIVGVDILFDGDDAGKKAAEHVKLLAEKAELSPRIESLPNNTDPGDLNKQQTTELKGRLYG